MASAAVLAGCSGSAGSADEELCAEVERVARNVAELDAAWSADVASEDLQARRALASHLLVAAGGSRGETPSGELAETVAEVGREGSTTPHADWRPGLEASYDACEDAGISLDRDPLDVLAER